MNHDEHSSTNASSAPKQDLILEQHAEQISRKLYFRFGIFFFVLFTVGVIGYGSWIALSDNPSAKYFFIGLVVGLVGRELLSVFKTVFTRQPTKEESVQSKD